MPNALRVLINLSHAVERDSMDLPFEISELEILWALLRKGYFPQRHQNNSIFSPIVISQLEFPLGELRIPPDAVEEFVDRDHVIRLRVTTTCRATIHRTPDRASADNHGRRRHAP